MHSRYWVPQYCGEHVFEVSHGDEKYVVDLATRSCACRMSELVGIPCRHAVTAIYSLKENPDIYVHRCYIVKVYQKAYNHFMKPLNNEKLWPVTIREIILPPLSRRMLGRPKKARRKEYHEVLGSSGSTKLSKRRTLIRCSKCKEPGHNRTTCQKDVSAEGESSRPTKKARKDKEPTTTPTEDPSLRPKTKSKGRTKTKGKGKEANTTKEKDKEATTAKGKDKEATIAKGKEIPRQEGPPIKISKGLSSGTRSRAQFLTTPMGRVSKKTTDTASTQVSAHLGTQGSTTTNAVPTKSPTKKKPTTLGLKRTRKRTMGTRATAPGVKTRSAASPMKQQWKI
ncbi:hypothetical protein IFM89_025434 [Coptis chinensis]|uniref:SWIM-type domain-containing protein n=1 Tax=Coptis chinensis TaxID=261450 RepID=A0A835LX83_9MAGN|nr:hypothetical protein IFM89_025434 [Coptis chinensis]